MKTLLFSSIFLILLSHQSIKSYNKNEYENFKSIACYSIACKIPYVEPIISIGYLSNSLFSFICDLCSSDNTHDNKKANIKTHATSVTVYNSSHINSINNHKYNNYQYLLENHTSFQPEQSRKNTIFQDLSLFKKKSYRKFIEKFYSYKKDIVAFNKELDTNKKLVKKTKKIKLQPCKRCKKSNLIMPNLYSWIKQEATLILIEQAKQAHLREPAN